MSYRVGFVMDQIAGHVTNYKNLRSVADEDPELDATWHEIHYYRVGGAIERLREGALPFLPAYATGVLRGGWEIHKALRRHRYDCLFSNASVGSLFARQFRRVPTVIDFDSTPRQIDRMNVYRSPVDSRPVSELKWRLHRNLMRAATLLHAWSRWAKQSAVDDYGIAPEKVVVNPPGVRLDFWRPNTELRRSPADGPLRVLFVGGDFARKGGHVLMAWYANQDPRRIEIHVVTREPVEPRPGVIVYQNVQPNSRELIELYQRSDLFVLPSLGECFGIATVEAMGAGLPVIASDVGGIADIIEPGRNGFIVPANDVASLDQAIQSVAFDPGRRERMGTSRACSPKSASTPEKTRAERCRI